MASTYATRAGDTWDLISYRVYGAERYMNRLIEANPDHRYTALFDADVALVVPDLPSPALPSTLPPWRRPA